MSTIVVVLAWLWTLPNNVTILAWSLVCRPTSAAWHNGCLEIRVKWLPMGAAGETWGRVILFAVDPARIRAHERVHVRDASILGPLFMPAYGIASLIAWLMGGHYYRDNWFECRARRISGH